MARTRKPATAQHATTQKLAHAAARKSQQVDKSTKSTTASREEIRAPHLLQLALLLGGHLRVHGARALFQQRLQLRLKGGRDRNGLLQLAPHARRVGALRLQRGVDLRSAHGVLGNW